MTLIHWGKKRDDLVFNFIFSLFFKGRYAHHNTQEQEQEQEQEQSK